MLLCRLAVEVLNSPSTFNQTPRTYFQPYVDH